MWIQSVQMTIHTKYISFGWYYSMKSKWCNDTVTGQQALYYWKSLLKNDVIKTIHNNYYIKSRDFISVVAKTKKSNKQQQRRSTRAIIHTVTYYSPKSLLPRSASLSLSLSIKASYFLIYTTTVQYNNISPSKIYYYYQAYPYIWWHGEKRNFERRGAEQVAPNAAEFIDGNISYI